MVDVVNVMGTMTAPLVLAFAFLSMWTFASKNFDIKHFGLVHEVTKPFLRVPISQ